MINIKKNISLKHHKLFIIFLLLLIFFFFGAFLFFINESYLLNTLFLLFFVLFSGAYLCFRLGRKLNDKQFIILPYLWIIKFCLTIFLLYVGWVKDLDPSSPVWGGDATRYYQDSWDLISNNWEPIIGSNYQGVIFYYAFIFYWLGHNPIIPALINIFVTLIAFLYLIKVVFNILPREKNDWVIIFILLVPEVIWFDVMTSRETLMGALIIFSVFPSLYYLYGNKDLNIFKFLFIISIAMLFILFVRTSIIIPVIACSLIYFLFLSNYTNFKISILRIFIVILVFGFLILGPIIQKNTGGYTINYFDVINQLQSFDNNVASGMEWSQNSIGRLLAPNSFLQSVLFLFPRVLLYLLAPLPNFSTDLGQLFSGSSTAWSWLMSAITSLFVILFFPYSLAGFISSWRHRKINNVSLAINLTFWIFIISIAGGNIIIVERYRIMITMLTFLTIWLGFTRSDFILVKKMALIWFSILFSGMIFFVIYKYVI